MNKQFDDNAVAALVQELRDMFGAESDGCKLRLSYYNRLGITVYPKGRDARVQRLRAALERVETTKS